jgi:two-component system LytT family response regulator
MKQLNCIIVDDDEIDRLTVVSYVKRFPLFKILGVFSSAEAALPALESHELDVLFLDIDMPSLSGIEFRKKATNVPVCIFITAHPEHAVESFEVETLDFIIKPIKLDRFTLTVQRIEDYMELKLKASLFESSIGGDSIYIKEGHEQTKVKLHDILYLEALKDYTKIITTQKKHCVLFSLGNLLKEANFNSFIRIHRSYAVQKQFIKVIGPQEVTLNNNIQLPVGRSFKDNLSIIL